MDKPTKAIINLKEGIVELEGSEEFVKQYLDELKNQISFASPKSIPAPISNDFSAKNNTENSGNEVNVTEKKKESNKPKKVKDIKVEIFDIEASGKAPSLKDFMTQKNPGTVAKNRIAVIAYYITRYKEMPTFMEGHIDFAYKALNLNKRPIYLRQILINLKNENIWFEEGDVSGSWKVTRVCENFVDEDLPPKDSKVNGE